MATDFVVFLIGGGDYTFDESANWKVGDHGELEISDPSNKRIMTFGPAAWQRVEQSGDYGAGANIW